MTTTQDTQALALPERADFTRGLQLVKEFQRTVQDLMVRGHDYGVIPGTGDRATLLKPGAEKILKLLGLADQYVIMDSVEDWNRPLFRYLIKCQAVNVNTGVVIAEGLGECNSMESKYRYRWEGTGSDRHRIENDDIYSQVNTILKMAKKRAMVDAALSVGRLSDLFTQDLEDLPGVGRGSDAQTTGDLVCPIHNVAFFQSEKMRSPAHKQGKEWCNFRPSMFDEQVKEWADRAGQSSEEVWAYASALGGATQWSKLTLAEIGQVLKHLEELAMAAAPEETPAGSEPDEATADGETETERLGALEEAN